MSRTFIPSLTGLRGAAAIWVFLFHIVPLGSGADLPLIRMGYVGVDIFFVLSGYILGHVHFDDFQNLTFVNYRRFIWLRLSRIYPVHFVTLMATAYFAATLYFLGVPVTQDPRFSWVVFVANFLLVQAWGWYDYFSFNTGAWSISAEFLMYLCFPLLVFVVRRLSPMRSMAIGFLLLALEITVLSLLERSASNSVALAPLRIAGEFCCGLGTYAAFRSGLLKALPWHWITDGLTLAFVVILLADSYFAALAVTPLLILGLAQGRGTVSRILSHRHMIFLGEISYSLYMVHGLVLDIGFAPLHYTRLAAGGWGLYGLASLLCVGLTAIATLVMHRFVEVPARKWMRQTIASEPSSADFGAVAPVRPQGLPNGAGDND